MIVFIGSVFSPYYALMRRRGPRGPIHHCAVNVVLYGGGGKRWAMTERGAAAVRRDATRLEIGPSRIAWEDDGLTLHLDEVTAPIPSRIRGTVRLRPAALGPETFTLDAAGRHRWRPIAPCARIEVDLSKPGRRWAGPAYLDTNDGDEPLERAFSHWNWSRAPGAEATSVLYETVRLDGSTGALALRYAADGGLTHAEAPPAHDLPPTRLWRMKRATRADEGPSVRQTLEDTPFYSRSVLDTRLLGAPCTAIHESLSLDRFKLPWVQAMLPFKAPRSLR